MGFQGFSFHWREMRQYTWQEMVGGLYEIYPSELADAMELPTAIIVLNRKKRGR